MGCQKCGYISCVCQILVDHVIDCRWRVSATCAIPIECRHGFDVCAVCDPCTCVIPKLKGKV